jgi:hypothetical protein
MNDNEFREYLRKRDAETIEDRVKRRSELSQVKYGSAELPELLWEYSAETIQLFICGHFASVILWCASIVELTLEDKLIGSAKGTKELIELLSFVEKTRLCRKFGIITPQDKNDIDDLRNLRNYIAHANAGKLTEMARVCYGDVEEALSLALPGLYLSDFGNKISSQALKFINFTRALIKRWYGEKQFNSAFRQG